MTDSQIHAYPIDAVHEDQTLGRFRLVEGYSPLRDAISIGLGTPRTDGSPRAAIATNTDGHILATGPYVQAPVAELVSPEGGTILLERAVIGGSPVGYVVSAHLSAGIDYLNTRALPGGAWMADRFRQTDGSPVPAFGPGTVVSTEDGEQPVEWLRPGDRVLTRDNGYQPVLWVARVDPAPGIVQIPAGALGPGLPMRRLLMTPAQHILLHGPELDLHFGHSEMFAAAGDLYPTDAVAVQCAPQPDCLYQLILPIPEVILVEGMWVGTLLADTAFLDTQPEAMARLAASLTRGRHGHAARGCLERWEVEMLRAPGLLAKGRIAA